MAGFAVSFNGWIWVSTEGGDPPLNLTARHARKTPHSKVLGWQPAERNASGTRVAARHSGNSNESNRVRFAEESANTLRNAIGEVCDKR
jgi:hypothetical protein